MNILAEGMADYMFQFKFLPAGRSLWAQGTDYLYERGSACLFNCGAVTTVNLEDATEWTFDMLMSGCGVGFDTAWNGICFRPNKTTPVLYKVPDTREGWAKSVYLHIISYTIKNSIWHVFDYDLIRPAGRIIHGFGGVSSGSAPLIELHKRIDIIFEDYLVGKINNTRLVADIMNSLGVCVVSGNVRRSAMLAIGDINDRVFLNLKNFKIFPERADIGWMSNNSVILKNTEDFLKLPRIVDRILENGEPGIINLLNIQKYGRVRYGEEKPDKSFLLNPCGEVPLEHTETCNLAEVFPTKCLDKNEFLTALKYATFYCSTITLYPTHRQETNSVMFKNRRIGVSLSGITDWLHKIGCCQMIRDLRDGYRQVESYNKELANEAGIPPSIRLTTVKPSGTISQMAGVSSGMNCPQFKYAIRRIRIASNSNLCKLLQEANVPNEEDSYSKNTTVFEFPINQGNARKANEVSVWEQFSLLATLQREWSDSSVSNTITFDPVKEADQLEHVLSHFIPIIKTVALLPHTPEGVYAQMPIQGINEDEYLKRLNNIHPINWNLFMGDGIDEKFCTNDSCNL